MSAPTVNAWVRSVDGGRLLPTIERSTHPEDGSSAECTDCGAGIENVTHDDVQTWVDEHDGCPAVVGLVHAAATVMRNQAVLDHAASPDSRDWSQLSPCEQSDWFTWVCGGPYPIPVSASAVVALLALEDDEEAGAEVRVEHHVFDRSGTVHAEFVGATGERLCAPGHTNEGRTAEPVDCARCRTLIDRAHIEALGIKKRAFAAYSRTDLAIRHWSRLRSAEQAAWLTWVAGDKHGPAPVLDTAADLAELQREDTYIDANRGDVAVAEVRDALDPPQVPPVPALVRELVTRHLAAAYWRVEVDQVSAEQNTGASHRRAAVDLLEAIVLPLYQGWARQAVIAELDELIDGRHNYTPGGWFRLDALEARRAELAALVEQAGAVTS